MSALRPVLLALACLVMTALAPTAHAQFEGVSDGSGDLKIARHQGRLVRLARPASSVFIANPEIADVTVKSSRMVYVFGKSTGRTTLFAVDNRENVVANLEIYVTHDVSALEEALMSLLPVGADVRVTSINGAIVLTGTVASAADAENIRRLALRYLGEGEEVINQLAITNPNQVNLHVRIAEVSRTAVKELGFNFDIFEGDFSFTSGDTFLKNPAALAGDGFFTLAGNPFGSGLFSGNFGNVAVNALFNALEEIGLAKTLAEPNLTALSGETASFLAGGEFPIPVDQSDSGISIEFKEFGVSLSFTPTLLSPQRISMRVRPEVSQLSNAGAVTTSGITVPALTTRRAETTIELGSGQSFAIAGLLQEDFQDNVRQVPYVADIPILGELFKSEQFRRNETELIIIVTPYVVQPMSGRDLPLPTDPLTKSDSDAVAQRSQADLLGGAIAVPLGSPNGRQLGSAKYLLD